MGDPGKIHVFKAFEMFLRTLQAYNAENFRQIDRRQNVHNACIAIGAFIGANLIATMIALGFWHLYDVYGDSSKLIICGPIVLTIVQMLITCTVLTMKNREIDETIGQLQQDIDQRWFRSDNSWTLLTNDRRNVENEMSAQCLDFISI